MQITKLLMILIVAGAAIVGVYLTLQSLTNDEVEVATDHKNIVYIIDGESVKLTDGVAETEAAPDSIDSPQAGSSSKVVTRYFGNELVTDLDGDGDDDIVFLLTQERGGSGIFFYAVAALNTDNGYVGSDGYFLGDRVAPQSTDISENPRHKNVIVVNYADRAIGESMTTVPSLAKSAYLKLDVNSMQWGIVEPNFEGESDNDDTVAESWGTIMGTVWLGPICPVVQEPPDPSCADRPYEAKLALTTIDESKIIKEFKSDADGKFQIDVPAGTYAIRSAIAANILPYCATDAVAVPINVTVEVTVNCDSGIR